MIEDETIEGEPTPEQIAEAAVSTKGPRPTKAKKATKKSAKAASTEED